MNIFLAFFQANKQHPISAYSFWEYYIKNGIEEAGHSWAEGTVDWAEGIVYSHDTIKLEQWKSKTWDTVLKEIKKQHGLKPISVFLSYLYPHQIDKQAIIDIQSLGIPCVNFFCDNVREFKNAPLEFSVFDLNWVPEYKAIDMYKKAKYNFIHLPMPMWVKPDYRNIASIENNEISFIGSKDIQRTMLFEEIVNRNIDLKIYGAGWLKTEEEFHLTKKAKANYLLTAKNQVNFILKFGLSAYYEKLSQSKAAIPLSLKLQTQLRGKITFEKYTEITKQSLITLGVNRYPSFAHPLKKPNTYSRLRDIEAPMLGACYLTEYTLGLENMYELGSEIETYKSTEEMISKIVELKNDVKKRSLLRVNGQKRSLNDHSIKTSLLKISNFLNCN